MTVLRAAFARGRRRPGFRLVQYAVQPDHLHFLVEAEDKKGLSEGVRGLCVRIARHLNAELGRAGKVFAERYHARALTSPREVRSVLAYVLLQERRHAAITARQPRTGNLADPDWVERTLDTAWHKLQRLGEWGYPFPQDDEGNVYRANLRGPDYMHFMRRRALRSGVRIFDHHPALELLGDGSAVVGASGVDRQGGRSWQVRAGAVVLATGGCAFGERMLGAAALTGDGYLMAAEAGAVLSGMEFSSQYATAPKPSALNKGLPFAWASFFREDGSRLETEGK